MTIGILKKAIANANRSKMYPYRIGCVIFRGKRIISSGFNQKRTSKRIPDKYKKYIETLHAEQHAVMSVKDKGLLKGADMLVIRVSQSGRLVMSKPCINCARTLYHFELGNIYYSNSEGEIIKAKTIDLILDPYEVPTHDEQQDNSN